MNIDLHALVEVTDMAEDAIRAIYRNNGQECHPAMRARFDAEMSVVARARAAYEEIKVQLGMTLDDAIRSVIAHPPTPAVDDVTPTHPYAGELLDPRD